MSKGYHKLFGFILFCFSPFFAKAQTAAFTYSTSNGLFCSPVTVNFTQTCTGNPVGFTWNFGNGTFANTPTANIAYTAGTYTVTLTAIYSNSALQSTQTIVINPAVTVALASDRPYICTPGVINFTASSNASSANYVWDFGDGSGTVTTSTPTINHNYSVFGSFTATVQATDIAGCFASGSTAITVQKPPITGTVSPTSGCIPTLANFTAAPTLPIGAMVSNYAWSFGDASNQNTSVNNTTHSYNAVGGYSPSVTITTNEGCTNTYDFPSVAFGTPPVNHIAYPKKLVICGSETAEFVSKAINANAYYWDFGDGNSATVTDTLAQHKYSTLGNKTVTVTPYFNGCAGTPVTFSIDVVGVIAGFTYANTCSNKNTYAFTNTSQGNLSTVRWDFGDGSATVSSLNPTHAYPTSGSFTTNLFVADNITGCTDNLAVNIYTATPSLKNPDLAICKNGNTTFTIEDNYANPAQTYQWNVIGQQVANATNPSAFTATMLGNYVTNFVVINNGAQSCLDTIVLSHPVLVRGPNLGFNARASICASDTINILNTSSAFIPADTVKLWYWNYGKVTTNDTIYQPATQVYQPGNYSIKLVGIDINGCKDSLIKPLTVNPLPFLKIIPHFDTLCFGQTDSLIAFHNGNLVWSPGATLSCTSCDTTIAMPSGTTVYYATATSSLGCVVEDTVRLKVFTPFTASSTNPEPYICQGESLQLAVDPPGKIVRWSPASNISDTTIYTPIANPNLTTTYIATLRDSAGCFSSTIPITVNVKTLPTVDAGPNQVLSYLSPFQITPVYSGNIASYTWTPATQLDCTTCAAPTGVAASTQTYSVKVISDSNCVATDNVTIFVECKYAYLLMPAAFTPNNDAYNNYFYPITRGIKSVTKFIIYNRYGQIVFQAKNIAPNNPYLGWDGRQNHQQQEPGTYVYFLEAICDQGQTLIKKGSVLLMR